MKVVIVGGVAAGASAAARLRRLDETAEIVMLERGGEVSYSNCGLPYYIGGVVPNADELLLQTPQSFWARYRVDVRVQSEVTAIDRKKKTVHVKNTATGEEYEQPYDRLILAPGAEARKLPIEGAELPGVYTLRTVQDAVQIRKAAVDRGAKSAVVIGGGFVGLEVAENLRHAGLEVCVMEGTDQIFPPFDQEMANIVTGEMERNGVRVYTKCAVEKIQTKENSLQVCSSQVNVNCDLVIVAVGVVPESGLAKACGLEVNERGGIVVDSQMATSDETIFAAGDVVEKFHRISQQRTMLPLAGPASKQGRVIADNLVGIASSFSGVLGASVCKVFGLTAACVGLNEKTLQAQKKAYETIYLSPSQHVGVYPGASPLTMKLLFGMDGKVLGCQCVGTEGVEKRVDVIAAAMRFGGSVSDLAEMELCYAPPYSSPKDPVNYAGYIAENVLSGRAPVKHWHDLAGRDENNSVLLDVRTPEEYQQGHLKESINIPVDELRERLEELPKDKEIWVYCQVGLRGYIAQRILMQCCPGQNIYNLSGGYRLLTVAQLLPKIG